MRKIILLLSLIVLCSYDTIQFNYLPSSGGEVVSHAYYTLSYSEEHEQAEWVAYELTNANFNTEIYRLNSFRNDYKVSTGSAHTNDYKYSGYDRGHLCPAADMRINNSSMRETFCMSNISPQTPGFNRGIWKTLETKVRFWAVMKKHLYVVTGPAFIDSIGVIGENKVEIPSHFYKVLFDYTGDEFSMIGFLLPNEKSSFGISNYAVSVDSVEAVTGIDFFQQLPAIEQDSLERLSNYDLWSKQ